MLSLEVNEANTGLHEGAKEIPTDTFSSMGLSHLKLVDIEHRT
ncbi:hypothetical protein [Streptomyces sp. NPDC048312]